MKTKSKTKKVWAVIDGEPRACDVIRENPSKYNRDNVLVTCSRGPSHLPLSRDIDVDKLYPSERALRKALMLEARLDVERQRRDARKAEDYHAGLVAKAERKYSETQRAFLRAGAT